MNRGTQLIAPEGLATLKKDQRCSFLKYDNTTGWATLVRFTEQTKGRRVHIHRILCRQFLEALDGNGPEGKLEVAEIQLELPPWLADIEGARLGELDLERTDAVTTNQERAEHRFACIEGLIPKLDEILAASNPFTIINAHAKALKPAQNRTRLAEWFFAYVCFGNKLLALYPEYLNTGTYDKSDPKYNDSHFGPVSVDKGRHHGWPGAMFADQVKKSVEDRLNTGWTKKTIYTEALEKDFGCRALLNDRGDWQYYHPEGKPFPDTYGKFWHQWYKTTDLKKTNLSLYGKHQARARAASKGSYAEEVGTFLGDMEVDAYFLKERPKVANGEGVSAKLCVARGICVGSKYLVGIGFSYESEKADVYGSMLFSAAIGLPATAELWGMTPKVLLPAPLKGLPPHLISDRGKAPIAAIIRNLQAKFPVKELTETYSGQSKPSVESGHPRNQNIEGPPSYRVSDKDVIQLIQREICLAALDNHQSYVGDLIIGSRATDETVNSPYALALLLDRQGLNDAMNVSEAEAARAFLPKVTYEIRDGGFWFETRCYSSHQMEESGIYDELNAGQAIEVGGYLLPMNLMWAWVEFRGRLFRLKQKLPARMGEHEMMMSLDQIMIEAELKRQLKAEHGRSANAAAVEARARFEDYTGVSWGDTSLKHGRARKSPDAAIEKKVLSPKTSRRSRKAA